MSLRYAFCIGLIVAGTVFAADPFIGTWELDVSKSKLRQPSNFTNGLTMKIEAAGNNTYRMIYDRQPAAAQEKGIDATTTTITFDGRTQPVPSGEAGTTITPERISDRHLRIKSAKHGKAVQTEDIALSEGGKVLTMSYKGMDRNGKPTDISQVFERR
jgi:hypothetical protein